MPDINILAVLLAAFVPNVLGAIYYGPLFGKQWAATMGRSQAELEPDKPVVTYGLALLAGFVIAFFMNIAMIMSHKTTGDNGELIQQSHNTFLHGGFHGLLFALTLVAPVVLSLGLFHKVNIKTTLLNIIFWGISFWIMGGILDVWR